MLYTLAGQVLLQLLVDVLCAIVRSQFHEVIPRLLLQEVDDLFGDSRNL